MCIQRGVWGRAPHLEENYKLPIDREFSMMCYRRMCIYYVEMFKLNLPIDESGNSNISVFK